MATDATVVFKNTGLILEKAPYRGDVQEPKLRQFLGRKVTFKSCLFGGDWWAGVCYASLSRMEMATAATSIYSQCLRHITNLRFLAAALLSLRAISIGSYPAPAISSHRRAQFYVC